MRTERAFAVVLQTRFPLMDLSRSCNQSTLGAIALRASTGNDRAFLQDVYESTRVDEFRAAGLDEQAIRELLATQFSMQDTYYRRHYPHGRFDIVLYAQTAVGRLYHDWSGEEARVIDIALLPAYRGAGIGTSLMHAIVAQAARRGIALGLYVEFGNPVLALYRRLGFECAGESGVYQKMHRAVAPFDDRDTAVIVGLAEPAAV